MNEELGRCPQGNAEERDSVMDIPLGHELVHPGAALIVRERNRLHVSAAHLNCSTILAAQCYAEAARRQAMGGDTEEVLAVNQYWPWESAFLIQPDAIDNLAKAGALIAAEIDRLLQLAAKKGGCDVSKDRSVDALFQ